MPLRCRTPPGVRGLKLNIALNAGTLFLSHPTRGAWIEIATMQKFEQIINSRTPPGVRGLKSDDSRAIRPANMSHPTRGAWIEIGRR